MLRPPPRSTRTDTLLPYTTLFRSAVSGYLSGLHDDDTRDAFAPVFGLQFDKKQDLRYGENPHQGAAFYSERNPEAGTISAATQLQGKELSYNNIADRSEEHTSELQSLMRISYAVFCLKKKKI